MDLWHAGMRIFLPGWIDMDRWMDGLHSVFFSVEERRAVHDSHCLWSTICSSICSGSRFEQLCHGDVANGFEYLKHNI